MAGGAYLPLDDALRITFTELVSWIHADYGLSALDASDGCRNGEDPRGRDGQSRDVDIAGVEKRDLPKR